MSVCECVLVRMSVWDGVEVYMSVCECIGVCACECVCGYACAHAY